MKVGFNKPFEAPNELPYLRESLANRHLSGDGPFTSRCQELLEKRFDASTVLLTTSCTSALELAALLCDIQPGDEVILPSFTFTSTANAFLLRQAKLVFVDICADTMNIDPAQIDSAINERTRAIVPVHYAGVSCDMDRINQIAKKHDLVVIEDAAQGVDAQYRGKHLGTIGDIGTYSFHETKNFVSGEGGAIVINSDRYLERAEILREKGTNRKQFFRGQVDKYSWVDVGSSFLPSDVLSALLLSQLECIDQITSNRLKVYSTYLESLRPLAYDGLLQLPVIPEECISNYHAFCIRVGSSGQRDELLSYLNAAGIQALFHYVPLHTAPMGLKLGYQPGMLPVTESQSAQLIRLPLHARMSVDEAASVSEAVTRFFESHARYVAAA